MLFNGLELDWHSKSCQRLDLVSLDGIQSCQQCGSFTVDDANSSQSEAFPANVQSDWHDKSCPRPDIITTDETKSCLRCGSFTAMLLPNLQPKSQIRLIRLLRGDINDDVQCEVFVENLSSLPVYEAISYTWADENGDDTLSRSITVSGRPFYVTRNCELALKRVRDRSDNLIIWIDSICIDQTNPTERQHQVGLMQQIYSRAKQVLAYLGEKTASDEDEGLWLYYSKELEMRRYFSRAWVLQELALAKRAIMVCGQHRIPWATLLDSVEVDVRRSVPLFQLAQFSRTPRPEQLLHLLDITLRCEATNPLDKVYAVLGLTIDEESHGLVADYTISPQKLYLKVALHLAKRHGWLPILSRAAAGHLLTRTTLPSWVPDWNSRPPPLRENEDLTEAEVLPFESAQYLEESNSLHFNAVVPAHYHMPSAGLKDCPQAEVYLFADGPSSDGSAKQYMCFLGVSQPESMILTEKVSSQAITSLPVYKLTLAHNRLASVTRHGLIGADISEMAGSLVFTRVLDFVCLLTLVMVSYFESHDASQDLPNVMRLVGDPWMAWWEKICDLPEYNRMEAAALGLEVCNGFRPVVGAIGGVTIDDLPVVGSSRSRSQIQRDIQANLSSWTRDLEREGSLEALRFEQSHHDANDHLGALWRQRLQNDSVRQRIFAQMGPTCDLWLDLNEAVWRLLVRLFAWKTVAITLGWE